MITLNSANVKKAMAWIDTFLTKSRGIKRRTLRNLEVNKILDEVKCPKCDSTQLTAQRKGFSYGRGIAGFILIGPIGWLAGYIRGKKIRITCLRCGFRWEPGQKDSGAGDAYFGLGR